MLRVPAVAAFVCAGVVLLAQAQPPQPPPEPQPPRPTFRAGTNLVRVDAAVSDDHGQPILDLTKDDFEVAEDGAPQVIESFKLLQLTGEQDAGDEESLPIRSNEHGRAEAARDEVRLFAIFLDDYHVNRFAETVRAQDALIAFLRTQLGPRDLVTLMDPLTPLDALRFTRDREELVMKIKAFQGRRGIYVPTRSAAEEEQLAKAQNIERVRTEVTLSALKALVTHLGSIRESRKTVIFLSGGFGLGRDLWNEFTETFQAASQTNTAIYPLDPGWLGVRSSAGTDVLRILADNTGGRAIVNMNRFEKAITQIVKDASAYYLIGYAPTKTVADGKFREIRVKVNRKGADVRARKGYWALTAEEAKKMDEVRPPGPPPEIARAFSPLATSRSGRPIDAWVGISRGAAGSMRIAFTWEGRPARDAAPGDVPAAVNLTAVDASGKERYQGTVAAAAPDPLRPGEPTGSASFELPPGASKLKIQVLNRADEMVDVEMREITVPDLWAPALALGTPRVIRARDGRQFQMLLADLEAPGTPVREFRRSDRLLIRFAVYSKGLETTVTARLVSRTGSVLATLPVAPSVAPNATHQVDLPLVNLGAGDYALRIEAVSGDATITELIALRVQ